MNHFPSLSNRTALWLSLSIALCTFASRASLAIENQLLPFTTDGCSSFPNGIPFSEERNWLKCCIVHDVSYWQGGTAAQKLAADKELRNCVEKAAGSALAEAMFLGVRAGGLPGLPTRWRWGYGWKIDRGFAPLNSDESRQATLLTARIPKNLESIPLETPPAIPVRSTLTGDYCLDAAVKHIEGKLGRSFTILQKSDGSSMTTDGTQRVLSLLPDRCTEPFRFTFLLLRPDACRTPMNELLARGRIRLMRTYSPGSCDPSQSDRSQKPSLSQDLAPADDAPATPGKAAPAGR